MGHDVPRRSKFLKATDRLSARCNAALCQPQLGGCRTVHLPVAPAIHSASLKTPTTPTAATATAPTAAAKGTTGSTCEALKVQLHAGADLKAQLWLLKACGVDAGAADTMKLHRTAASLLSRSKTFYASGAVHDGAPPLAIATMLANAPGGSGGGPSSPAGCLSGV